MGTGTTRVIKPPEHVQQSHNTTTLTKLLPDVFSFKTRLKRQNNVYLDLL